MFFSSVPSDLKCSKFCRSDWPNLSNRPIFCCFGMPIFISLFFADRPGLKNVDYITVLHNHLLDSLKLAIRSRRSVESVQLLDDLMDLLKGWRILDVMQEKYVHPIDLSHFSQGPWKIEETMSSVVSVATGYSSVCASPMRQVQSPPVGSSPTTAWAKRVQNKLVVKSMLLRLPATPQRVLLLQTFCDPCCELAEPDWAGHRRLKDVEVSLVVFLVALFAFDSLSFFRQESDNIDYLKKSCTQFTWCTVARSE